MTPELPNPFDAYALIAIYGAIAVGAVVGAIWCCVSAVRWAVGRLRA